MPEARIKTATSIMYHTQYGTAPSSTVGYDGFPLEEKHLPVLTYEGYKFIGWYYDEAFTQEAKVGDIVDSYNFYLYAKWVEVPTVKSKMTAIADEIRTLSGTTSSLGLDAMATHVGEANDEISSQVELLAQVISALDGKAAGSDLTPIADALTEKGVEVPSGAGVGALAGLIAAIEVGGGIAPFTQMITGTITPASGITRVDFPDNIEGLPALFAMWIINDTTSPPSSSAVMAVGGAFVTSSQGINAAAVISLDGSRSCSYNTGFYETYIVIPYKLAPSYTYNYVLFTIDKRTICVGNSGGSN